MNCALSEAKFMKWKIYSKTGTFYAGKLMTNADEDKYGITIPLEYN